MTVKIGAEYSIYCSDINLKLLNDGRKVKILTDIHFRIGSFCYVVPSGYVSDGASIPRPLWSLVGSPFCSEWREGAYLHDHLRDKAKTLAEAHKADELLGLWVKLTSGAVAAAIIEAGVKAHSLKQTLFGVYSRT
jgi:hypothetical protein